VDAKKLRKGEPEARALLEGKHTLVACRGKKVERFDLREQPLDGEFLAKYDPDRPGCLVLDVRMPEMSGLEVQQHLNRSGAMLPVILITGHGDIPMAVQAMKDGAFDFLQKPFRDQELLDRINAALKLDAENRANVDRHADLKQRSESLTPREREVMAMVVDGKANKVIAHDMQLSTKTVETHRAHIMRKLGVNSMAGLMWMALSSGEFDEVPDQLPFPAPQFKPEPFALR